MNQTKHTALTTLLIPIICIVTAISYWGGLNGIFLLDDSNNITPTLMTEFDLQELLQIASSNKSGMFRRPFSVISFTLTSLAHGPESWGFKYHNLMLHLLTGIMLLLFTIKLVSSTENNPLSNRALVTAIAVTAIWLLHPLHVSTVLYSVQRMTQWATFFTLCSLIAVLNGITARKAAKKVLWLFFLFPFFLIMGLASKENAALIPLLASLIIWYTAKAKTHQSGAISTSFIALFIGLPLLLGGVIFLVEHESILDYSSRTFSMADRLIAQVDFIVLYIKQLTLPRLSEMGLYFDDYVIAKSLNYIWFTKLAFITLAFFVGLIGLFKRRLWGLGITFFFVAHSLESSILPLELAFEHRNYLPSIGVFIAIIDLLNSAKPLKNIQFYILPLWVLALVTLLNMRVEFWSNGVNWQQTTLAFHPKSERTRINYIYDIENLGEHERAAKEIIRSMDMIPNSLSFPVLYLASTCHTSKESENTAIIDNIYDKLKNNNLSVIGFNSLAALLKRSLAEECSSIDIRQVSNIINTAEVEQRKKTTKSLNYAYIKILQGKIFIRRGMTQEGSASYMAAYEFTNDANEVFSAAKTLLLADYTREQGLKMFEEIKHDKYFNATFYQHEISRIQKRIDEGNFTFNF